MDGAIHTAAGRQLKEACREVPLVRKRVRSPTGEARITPGFNLKAKHVIHTGGTCIPSPTFRVFVAVVAPRWELVVL